MDAQRRFRLILDPPRDGPWNMAADEWLLHSTYERGEGCLRLYRWQPVTLSLGYFQTAESLASHPLGNALPTVRRLSGGGAIVHHHEWTYSLTLPIEHPLAQDRLGLYLRVHRTLLDWLAALGFSARIFQSENAGSGEAACGSLAEDRAPAGEREESDVQQGKARLPGKGVGNAPSGGKCPFLCFLRRSPGDVLVQSADGSIETKIVGSAQRRARGAVLQHGSILFAQSPFTPELPGLCEMQPNRRHGTSADGATAATSRADTAESLAAADALQDWDRGFPEQWLPLLEQSLDCRWQQSEWSTEELSAIERLRLRYDDPAWNRHRRGLTA